MRRMIAAALAAACVLGGCTTITRQSVSSTEEQSNGVSGGSDVSDDGRYVVFVSTGSNLVTGDTNNATDAFVRDTVAGTTTRVSVGPNGVQSNGGVLMGNAIGPQTAIDPDGTVVAFVSSATNLDNSVANRAASDDVFVRDLVTGTTETISTDGSGSTLPSSSFLEGLSTDGRYVLFESAGTVYLTDRVLDTRSAVVDGTDPFGVCGTLGSDGVPQARMNGDASKIAFEQRCALSTSPTGNDRDHVVVLDRALGTTVDAHSFRTPKRADGMGRMAYAADADLLVWSQSSINVPVSKIWAWESTRGAFELVGNATNALLDPYASRTGRYVAFTEAVTGGTQVQVFDRNVDGIAVASTATDGSDSTGTEPVMSNDEGTLVFSSVATDLVSGDTNNTADVFTRPISDIFGGGAAIATASQR